MVGPGRDLPAPVAAPPESFIPVVVADLLWGAPELATVQESIVAMVRDELTPTSTLFFFKDHALLPADADGTALAASLLLRAGDPPALAHAALDRIAANVDAGGVVATYFDSTGERAGIVDEVVGVNALVLAYQLGRAAELRATEAHVTRFVLDERHLTGTRYYPSADTFAFFLGRLVTAFPEACPALHAPLRRMIAARAGTSHHPLDLAQRVIVGRALGAPVARDEEQLHHLQRPDGSWPADGLFRYGRRAIYFGSPALSTAFAVRALFHDEREPSRMGGAHG